MRDAYRSLLTAMGTVLALWLILGFWPLSTSSRVVLSLLVVLVSGVMFWCQRRASLARATAVREIVDENLQVRRMYVVASRVLLEKDSPKEEFVQLDLFEDVEKLQAEQAQEEQEEKRERSIQEAMLDIKKKVGENAILKGMNFSEGATTIERNGQVGGHKA